MTVIENAIRNLNARRLEKVAALRWYEGLEQTCADWGFLTVMMILCGNDSRVSRCRVQAPTMMRLLTEATPSAFQAARVAASRSAHVGSLPCKVMLPPSTSMRT